MNETWMISANSKTYNFQDAFSNLSYVDWKQNRYKYKEGDIVYIYASSPFKILKYKTIIKKINVSEEESIKDYDYWVDKDEYKSSLKGKYIRLKLLEEYDDERLSYENLLKNGLNAAPQGAVKVKKELKEYIELITKSNDLYPDEISNNIYEGAKKSITVNRYERNVEARQRCLDYHGYDCMVCGLNFEKEYGDIGKNFIHVHHIVPLYKIDKEYKVDPIKDLIPVCPNCHAMIHRGLKIEGLTQEL